LTTIIHTIYIRSHFFVLLQNIFIKFIQLLFTAYRYASRRVTAEDREELLYEKLKRFQS